MKCIICNQETENAKCSSCGFNLEEPVFCCVHNYNETTIQNIQHRYTEAIKEFFNSVNDLKDNKNNLINELRAQIRTLNEKLKQLEQEQLTDTGDEFDGNSVLENLLREAELGNSEAQYKLGCMYFDGIRVKKDYTEALTWFRISAYQGNSEAQNSLGVMYQQGNGDKKQYKEAVKWFQRSAQQGNSHAQYNLGRMYERGYGVQIDYKEAVKWYKLAADQEDNMALNALGDIYRLGIWVKVDYEKAVEFYLRSAEQGNIKASSNLEKIFGQYKNIAETGKSKAKYNLGYMYEKGYGVKANKKTAVEWYQLAAEQGNKKAQKILKTLNID